MIRTIYTSNRSMNVIQKKMENSGGNMANLKTPGYKFQDIVESTLKAEDMINYQGGTRLNRKQDLGEFTFGNKIDQYYYNFRRGNLQHTENESDFAINGEGFFTLRLRDGGLGYTRNGNFRLDEENRLVTMDGHRVMGRGPNGLEEIRINTNRLSLDQQGNIEGSNLRFNIVDFEDKDQLESRGDTIFVGNPDGELDDIDIRQGYLEMSNVNMADEMVKLIEYSRQFESNQRVVVTADETLAKAVNEIGRVW